MAAASIYRAANALTGHVAEKERHLKILFFVSTFILIGGCADMGAWHFRGGTGSSPMYRGSSSGSAGTRGGGYAPRAPREPSTVKSEIVSGERKWDDLLKEWDVQIEVSVTGEGPAFGYFEHSSLSLWGTSFVEESDRWIIVESFGYPNYYRVEAEYSPMGDNSGVVEITVTVDDVASDSYGTVAYRATHPITWKQGVKP